MKTGKNKVNDKNRHGLVWVGSAANNHTVEVLWRKRWWVIRNSLRGYLVTACHLLISIQAHMRDRSYDLQNCSNYDRMWSVKIELPGRLNFWQMQMQLAFIQDNSLWSNLVYFPQEFSDLDCVLLKIKAVVVVCRPGFEAGKSGWR